MNATNPYEAPKSRVDDAPVDDDARLQRIASGQKLAIYAILLNFGTLALQPAIGVLASLLALPALVCSVIGVFRMGDVVTRSVVLKVILVLFLIVPVLNLLVLVALSGRATTALRAGGYRVGLLGASKKG